jgi:hypothetical protein
MVVCCRLCGTCACRRRSQCCPLCASCIPRVCCSLCSTSEQRVVAHESGGPGFFVSTQADCARLRSPVGLRSTQHHLPTIAVHGCFEKPAVTSFTVHCATCRDSMQHTTDTMPRGFMRHKQCSETRNKRQHRVHNTTYQYTAKPPLALVQHATPYHTREEPSAGGEAVSDQLSPRRSRNRSVQHSTTRCNTLRIATYNVLQHAGGGRAHRCAPALHESRRGGPLAAGSCNLS